MIVDPGAAPKRIAVVGTGVAGLTAAYLLNRKHDVTLFERNGYLGGHTNTVELAEGPDAGTSIDTGFIVMNDKNYPLFKRLLQNLDVPLQDSNMSFSYWCRQSGLYYSGTGVNGLLAQRRNLLRPRFISMVRDILRFYKNAANDLDNPSFASATLGEYVEAHKFSDAFTRYHLLPMGAAIWSTPSGGMMNFPALAFLRFFQNHGLLGLNTHHQWRTIPGGSQRYVRAIRKTLRGDVHLNAEIASIQRSTDGATLQMADGSALDFDEVVIGAHADQALGLLGDPTPDESRLLGAWTYESNHAMLHTSESLLPPRKRAWASWNVLHDEADSTDAPVAVNYYMNKLQSLETQHNYIVSLNKKTAVRDEDVVMETTYLHPTYTFESMSTQEELPTLNGVNHTWFCGSYFGYGFHEDAVRSGVKVAQGFGIDL